MSQKLLRGYRFATEAQWNTCLFTGADRDSKEARTGLRPFAPYAGPPTRFETSGGYAPAVSCVGEVLWRDDQGKLQRLPYGDDAPLAVTAPYAVAHATRLVAASSTLWAAGEPDGSLQGFDLESLARELVVEIANARVVDIAGDGHDGLYALLELKRAPEMVDCVAGEEHDGGHDDPCAPSETDGPWEIAHYDCAGQVKSRFVLQGITQARALVYLQRVDRLVVLSGKGPKLYWFAAPSGEATFSIPVTAVRPCFDVSALGSDGRARLCVAGTDGAPFGGRHHVLTLDSEGNLLGDVEVDERPTGVTANRTHLLVTTARGLLRFESSKTVSPESSEVMAALVTPVLQSPSTEDLRRWLRVEATAKLPAGSTLEISYASTDDRDIRDQALRLARDPSVPASQRLRQLRSHFGQWRSFSFHGADTALTDESVPLSAPLFDVREQYLWVSISLSASPGGGLPMLSELAVLYPGRTLMESLPAVYQRAEAQPGSFLRSLVGVLESTTQNLDARIGDMGRHVHPLTAPGPWLDFVARWLGLPWDDALSLDQKRGIARHAADIATARGTRAGLEALLDSLMPEKPRRFRVVDDTADFGLATVGGEACAGSRLPVMLGGLPSTASELGSKAILGRARLPCPESDGGASRLVGRIRVDVSANADEQSKWQPWLRALIDDMVPATTRVQLRWISAAAFRQDLQLDESLQLDAAPMPHLGTDAVTGIARLPGQRGILLSGAGADSGSPLH